VTDGTYLVPESNLLVVTLLGVEEDRAYANFRLG
jgi:hypothetical protein